MKHKHLVLKKKYLTSLIVTTAFLLSSALIMALNTSLSYAQAFRIGEDAKLKIRDGRFAVTGGALDNNQGGTILGEGILDVTDTLFTNSGNINSGASSGVLDITGDMTQTTTGALNIEIGGTDDNLNISGHAALAGALNVSLVSGFSPVLSETFQVVNYFTGSGSFDTLNMPVIADGPLGWDVELDAGTVTLTVVGCTYSISPAGNNFASSGGPGTVDVTATAGCEWETENTNDWISIDPGGKGNGTVSYSVSSNSSTSERTGTMAIAGLPFTITQDGEEPPPPPPPGGDDDDDDGGGGGGGGGDDDDEEEEPDCEYSISPEEESFTSEGGEGSVDIISTEDGCGWTASSNNGWIFITSGSGSGDGTIEYTVSKYTGETSRTSYFTITGDNYTATVTVTQEGTGGGGGQCAYSISSTEEYFMADSGTSSLSVTTDDGCEWTAVSNEGWTNITSGSSGTGSGTVEYSVLENTGSDPRTGTMTIAGKTCTVTQSEGGGGGGVGNPLPDIQANSSDGPVILQKGEMLSVTVSLNPGGNVEDADWWVYATTTTPFFQTYWYTLDSGWVPSDTPIRVHGGPLFSLAPYTIVESSRLPIGNYVFNFEVDNNMDNFRDGTWTDSVEVTVEEGGGVGVGLSSPTGFTASADGTTVTLSWDAVDEAEGYMLYYGYSSGEYSGAVDLGNSTGMVFENVPEGTYYVVITAYAGTEESGYSEEVRVTVR